MNIQHLRKNFPKLIMFMQEHDYSSEYVARLRREVNFVLTNADVHKWESYRDVYDYHTTQTDSAQVLRDKLTRLGIIERFDLRSEFPDGRTRQKVKERGYYQYLSQEFKQVIDTYREYEKLHGTKKARTIYGESSNTASFLYELQCVGISNPESITQKDVITIFLNEDGTLRRSCSYKKIIAAVFKANVPTNPKLFNRLIVYLPELRETRKSIQYLTDEEINEVKRALAEPNSGLSLRDKAIGTLALCYGLRCCDIAALKVSEVDLICDKISIHQQKTAVPLELPLTTAVGNAIYDYAE